METLKGNILLNHRKFYKIILAAAINNRSKQKHGLCTKALRAEVRAGRGKGKENEIIQKMFQEFFLHAVPKLLEIFRSNHLSSASQCLHCGAGVFKKNGQ